MDHLELLMALISLSYNVRQGVGNLRSRNKQLDTNSLDEATDQLHHWCDELYIHVYPIRGIPWWSCDDMSSANQLFKASHRSNIRQAMAEYITHRFTNAKPLKRRACANLHLELSQTIAMMKLDDSKLREFLTKEEKEFSGDLSKSLGIILKNGKAHYFRFYGFWLHHLHTQPNAVQAFKNLQYFLQYLGLHPYDPLLPSIAHAAELLEIGMVLLLAFYAVEDKHDTVHLPQSYVHLIHYWDTQQAKGGKGYIHMLVDKRLPLSNRLRNMAELAGHMTNKVKHQFNMIEDAFGGHEEYIRSGETERVLVLALTMLCNSGRMHLLDDQNKNRILDALSRVDMSQEKAYKYPQRIQRAFHHLRDASNAYDVSVVLSDLLKDRHNEAFRTYRWEKGRFMEVGLRDGICREYFRPLSAREARYMKFSEERERAGGEMPQAPVVMGMDASLVIAQASEEGKSLEKEQNAARVILRVLQKNSFRKSIRRGIQELIKKSQNPYRIHINDFMDQTMCHLCYVPFPSDQDLAAAGEGNHYSLKSHSTESTHRQNVMEFRLYEKCVNEDVSPVMLAVDEAVKKGKDLMEKCPNDMYKEELQKVSCIH